MIGLFQMGPRTGNPVYNEAYADHIAHSIHLHHTSDFDSKVIGKKPQRVVAQAEQSTILGFVTQTDYVNVAFDELQQKCPQGTVTGINTRYSTSHGFFSWTNKVRMDALCVQ